MINLNSIVSRHPDQVAAIMDGEVVMMNVNTGKYYALNEVATAIWNWLPTPLQMRDVCACIQDEFEVAPEICERDTLAFVEGMVKDGLLLIGQPTSTESGRA